MPDVLRPRSDRTALAVVGALALLLIVLSVVFGARRDEDAPTTYSAASAGMKAAYQVLEAAGYRVGRWERPMDGLPLERATLVIAEPPISATDAERSAVRRFLAAGGRVVATGQMGASYLPDHRTEGDGVAGLTWERVRAQAPSAITRAAPAITLAPSATWDEPMLVTPLYADARGRRLVVAYPVGDGLAIWWASATPMTNAGLRESANLEFVIACLGGRDRQIYWNEYVHGHSAAAALAPPGNDLGWLAWQALFIVVVVLATYARRSGPIIPALAETRLSPLEFVRMLGALYERAGVASLAVAAASQRFRSQISRRLGIRTDAPVDVIERGVRDRWAISDPAFGALLRTCDDAGRDDRLAPKEALKLVRSLSDWNTTLGLSSVRTRTARR